MDALGVERVAGLYRDLGEPPVRRESVGSLTRRVGTGASSSNETAASAPTSENLRSLLAARRATCTWARLPSSKCSVAKVETSKSARAVAAPHGAHGGRGGVEEVHRQRDIVRRQRPPGASTPAGLPRDGACGLEGERLSQDARVQHLFGSSDRGMVKEKMPDGQDPGSGGRCLAERGRVGHRERERLFDQQMTIRREHPQPHAVMPGGVDRHDGSGDRRDRPGPRRRPW